MFIHSRSKKLRFIDEYVVNELRTNENFHRESEKILWHDIPIGRAVTDISLIASFKYFVKLRELKYEIESDTLVVNVPSLYLSTPVAYDSATVKNNCNASTPFVDCKSTINILMSEVTGKKNLFLVMHCGLTMKIYWAVMYGQMQPSMMSAGRCYQHRLKWGVG